METLRQKGHPLYLAGIVLVAVLGGLLFGYDTAVISGAEKGLQEFFRGAADFSYTDAIHGFTTSSALIGCVIGAFLSGLLASRLGRKKALFVAGILFLLSALGSYSPEFLFFRKGVPTLGLLFAFNGYRILGGIGVGMHQNADEECGARLLGRCRHREPPVRRDPKRDGHILRRKRPFPQ